MSPLVRVEQPPCVLKMVSTVMCLEDGCESLWSGRGDSCPACGSRSWMPLTRWLNRKPAPGVLGRNT